MGIIMRSGTFIRQPTGYKAFIPNSLGPGSPQIKFDDELQLLLSNADRSLSKLDGIAYILPNPDLFVAMYARKEALLSSQIEGTQTTLVAVLEYESLKDRFKRTPDVIEVVNYVAAMNYGLKRLETLPLSIRLICEIHKKLLEDTRASDRNPGQLKESQNWIGPDKCTLDEATFVPPPPNEAKSAMYNLEDYMHKKIHVPPLINCGIIHSQFETIHPFSDGNGRMGRLLITFLLCKQGVLSRPLVYLSYFFKQNRQEYDAKLQAVRQNDDWEGWLKFFLKGIVEVSEQATHTALDIVNLQKKHQEMIQTDRRMNSLHLLNYLYKSPIITIRGAAEELKLSFPTTSAIIKRFEELGLLKEQTGTKYGRVYAYLPYLKIFIEGTNP